MSKAQRQKAEARGRKAEWIVVWYLRLRGYKVLARQEKTHVGEIDIVARRGNTLVFVEVKARDTSEAGLNAIPSHQRQRIIRAANSYVSANPALASCDIRFDAVVISPSKLPIHIKDAWRP